MESLWPLPAVIFIGTNNSSFYILDGLCQSCSTSGGVAITTLLAGYTDAFDEGLIRRCFEDDVIVLGPRDARAKGIRWVSTQSQTRYRDLMQTHDFDRVVYVSQFLNYMSDYHGEPGDLRACLQGLGEGSHTKFVFVGSNLRLTEAGGSWKIIIQSLEDLCAYYRSERGLDLLVVRSPFLVCPEVPSDYLHRTFEDAERRGAVVLKNGQGQVVNCMCVERLADLLLALFVDWREELELVDLIPPQGVAAEDVARDLRALFPKAQVSLGTGSPDVVHVPEGGNAARDFYHWDAGPNPLSQLRACYARYDAVREARTSVRARVVDWIDSHHTLVIALEVAVGAALAHLAQAQLASAVQFRSIDVRLLYIVLISIAYGVGPGLAAAALMCVSLAYSYLASGMDLASLFYWYENWLPFLLYLALGGIVGYVHTKQSEENDFLRSRYDRVSDRLAYVEDLYRDSLRVKDTYRSELVQSKNGFGKIYEVVQRLSVFEPREIFLQSIPVIEDVLSCDSVALFSVDEKSPDFARLQVCSQAVRPVTPTTYDLVRIPQVMDALATDDVWFNSTFDETLPDYVACVRDHGKLRTLITLRNVTFEQMNGYYMNLIRIMARLMENFLVKAWEYESSQSDKAYLDDTIIMRTASINERLAYCRTMENQHLGTFRLLCIHTHGETVRELDQALRRYVRTSDYLGLGTDGNLYLLALQVDDDTEHFLLKRFRDLGWDCEFVRDDREAL